MAHISIIGTGTMGQAIAGIAAKGGHTVELLNTSTMPACHLTPSLPSTN